MGVKTAYRKDYLPHEKKADISVSIGADGTIKIYRSYLVVKEIENKEEDREMIVKEAQKLKKDRL